MRAQARPAGQVDRHALGRHGRHPPRARPDRLRQDRRQARRHASPASTPRSSRTAALPPDRGPGDPDVQRLRDRRLLQVPGRPDRHRRRVHEQVHDRRDPRRGPPRGDPHHRAHDGRARRRARHGPARAAAEELHHGVPVRAARTASSTTRATTTARSTSCSSTSTSTRSGASRPSCASGRLPRRRLLDLRRDLRPRAVARARPEGLGHAGRLLRVRARCACTRPARSPSTPAPRRTARGSRPASRRSWPTGWASTPRSST